MTTITDAAANPLPRMTLEEALSRIDYRLKFACHKRPRDFGVDNLQGESIPDSNKQGRSRAPGEWYHNYPDWLMEQEGDWTRQVLRMAMAEAVHEVLEWLRLDGEVVIDPHGKHEATIYDMCDDFSDQLCRMIGAIE